MNVDVHEQGRTGLLGGREVSRWADDVKKIKKYTQRYIWAAVTQISRDTISSQFAPVHEQVVDGITGQLKRLQITNDYFS